ncbi:MAG: DNA polymerase III subunit psi [Sulfuriferula sp.]
MPNNAILTELELMPVWRLRVADGGQALAALAELTAIRVLTQNGALGWALVTQPLMGDEEVLFVNMLRAMKLEQGADLRIDCAQIAGHLERHAVAWLWLLGAEVAQTLGVSLTAAVSSKWQGLPLFLSAHPRELLLQPAAKAKAWSDWCCYVMPVISGLQQ